MMGFMITYETASGRKRKLLAIAMSFEAVKKIAESHLADGEKILEIKYIPEEKI